MTRAVFFDRDGIVNVRRPDDYVTSWEEFDFLPDVFTALPRVHAMGYRAIIVSNQRGVALGRMTREDVDAVHAFMQQELSETCGEAFDDIFVCPHDNSEHCACRKPEPGMILRAAEKWDIDCAKSWMIGDAESDVVAGRRAGCRTILVGAPRESVADVQCASLNDAIGVIEAAMAQEESAE